ncbi:MAG: hypothetical protein HYS04_16990 [Acidobacteria bacterium]|nr:hypothetical protein [Acidobacteriota bacterium]
MRRRTDVARTVPLVCALLVGARTTTAQILSVTPDRLEFLVTANSLDLPSPIRRITITPVGVDKLEVKYSGLFSTGEGRPDFVVVWPSSGVAPTAVWVGLNRNVVPYLRPGTYTADPVFVVPGQPCPRACGGTIVTLRLSGPPPPSVTGVLNTATLEPWVSPGAMVSILGTDLSTPPIAARYDDAGLYPTSLGDTTVTFNGIAAPLLYVNTMQINAVVPYGVAGQKSVEVVVTHYQRAPPFSLPLMDTSPGVFTATQTGRGQGAILNANGTFNSGDNPAPKGSVIQIFATGAGPWVSTEVPPLLPQNILDGSIFLGARFGPGLPRPAAPVSLTIGGQPARMQYLGPAPYQVFGMLQVNAVVPEDIDSGPQ